MALEIETDGLFADGLADAVTYNNGTAQVDVSAIVDYGSLEASKPGRQASILVKKSDVPDPEYRHSFVIDGATWHVAPEQDKDFVLSQGADFWVLRIQRSERSTQWRR